MRVPRGPRRWSALTAASLAGSIVAGTVPRMASADPGQATPFAGTFADDQLRLDLSVAADGTYAGTLTKAGAAYPVRAGTSGPGIAGTFVAARHPFPFTATLADGHVVLQSGGNSYTLAPLATNPLGGGGGGGGGAGGPPTPPPPPVGVVDGSTPLGRFRLLGATPTGKTLFITLPTATTVEAALTQAADALGQVLDAKPTLGTAFADAQGHRKGGVILTGKLRGAAVKGLIFCGPGPTGATATVILARADAQQADLKTLFGFMPAPPVKMQTHAFPDGSGSVDLPDGWTALTPTAMHGVYVSGPGGQLVVFSNIMAVNDPNCRLVGLSKQTYALKVQNYNSQMRQYQHGLDLHRQFPRTPEPVQPKPPVAPDPDPNVTFPGMTFCPYCDGPEEVLKVWYPLNEQIQRRAGGPYTTLDKIIEVLPLDGNPAQPGSKAGLVYLALTDHDGDKATPVRALNRIATANIIPGQQWQLVFSNMRAPDATFDRDLPVMTAVMNSIRLDMNVVTGEINAEGAAVRKMSDEMFQGMQRSNRAFQDQQAASFNAHEEQIAAQEQARHDSASDFIEYIGGVRHVYDADTGKTLNVDLFNANAIVNGLNDAANDPNRFVQVPLRYER